MDNNRNSLTGQALLILQLWFRNLFLGILNSLLRPLEYPQMLTVLMVSECFFLLVFALSIRREVYELKVKMWVYVVLNLLKVCLMGTLLADYGQPLSLQMEELQQLLILLQLLIFAGGMGIELVNSIFGIKDTFKKICCYQSPKSH